MSRRGIMSFTFLGFTDTKDPDENAIIGSKNFGQNFIIGPRDSGKFSVIEALSNKKQLGRSESVHYYSFSSKKRDKIQLWYVNLDNNAARATDLQKARLIFLTLDVKHLNDNEVAQLRSRFELYFKDKPVILVINKMDLVKSDEEKDFLHEKAHMLAEALSAEATIFCSALNRKGIKDIFDCLDVNDTVRKNFHEAKRLINQHLKIKNEYAFSKKADKDTPEYKLYKAVNELWVKVKKELNEEGQLRIAEAIKELAKNLPQLTLKHIENFHNITKPFRVKPGWHEILSAIIGSLVGVVIGAGIGAALGFAGIVPLVAGAAIGTSLVVVGAPLGGWGSFWYRREHDPLNQIEKNVGKLAPQIVCNKL